jgi:hypothetical protein
MTCLVGADHAGVPAGAERAHRDRHLVELVRAGVEARLGDHDRHDRVLGLQVHEIEHVELAARRDFELNQRCDVAHDASASSGRALASPAAIAFAEVRLAHRASSSSVGSVSRNQKKPRGASVSR